MLGLLIKDFYNVRKQAAWYALMLVLFCITAALLQNIAFAATMGILITISVPITAIAYEEKDGWQKFVIASGLSTKIIVGEKYFLGILCALVCSAGYSVTYAAAGIDWDIVEFILPLCMQFWALSVVLPIVFAFGVEKGRTYMIAIIVVLIAAFIGCMPLLGNILEGNRLILPLCSAAATIIVLALSIFISIKIYNKKEF